MLRKKNPKKQNAPGTKKFHELDGNEIVKPKLVDKDIAKKLQQARSAKKLKQKEHFLMQQLYLIIFQLHYL